jgi:hypothetical protein
MRPMFASARVLFWFIQLGCMYTIGHREKNNGRLSVDFALPQGTDLSRSTFPIMVTPDPSS